MRIMLVAALVAFAIKCTTVHAQAARNETVVLTTANSMVIRGVIDDASMGNSQNELEDLYQRRGNKNYTIYIVLDSPGGSIDAGLAFIEYAKTVPNVKTISIFAASMASAIAEALPGERLVTANGTMMFHRAAGGFEGYFNTGEVESRLWVSTQIVRTLEETNYTRMKMKVDDYKSLIHDELWLYGKNNLYYRSADKIVDVVCTTELIKKEYTTSNILAMLFGGDGTMRFSACPLFRTAKGDDSNKYLVPTVKNFKLISNKLRELQK